jgi:prolyl oligopeptidase
VTRDFSISTKASRLSPFRFKETMRTLIFVLAVVMSACATAPAVSSSPPVVAPTMESKASPGLESKPMTMTEDPYLWLENVTDEKALAWASEQSKKAQSEIEAAEGFAQMKARFVSILSSKERIAMPSKMGKYLYNFWRDEKNPRGLWRRTSLASFQKKDVQWESVLDIDELGKTEKENWVYKGSICLHPTYEKCMVSLSRGGADASVFREFDTKTKQFVKDGFFIKEAKSNIAWKDANTLLVGTDFGPGSMTKSGYPRIAKEWKRGTPLDSAKTLVEGADSDISVSASRRFTRGKVYDTVSRGLTFFSDETRVFDGKQYVKIDKPDDAEVDFWGDQMLLTLRSDWTVGGKTFQKGAALMTDYKAFMKGQRTFTELFVPSPKTALNGLSGTATKVLVRELDDVKPRVSVFSKSGATWTKTELKSAAGGAIAAAFAYDEDENDTYWLLTEGFGQPTSLSFGDLKTQKQQLLKQNPSFFDSAGLSIEQFFATSKDGTKVPYFQVAKSTVKLDGTAPTLLYGYGGFEVSQTEGYAPLVGAGWLEKGGVYVLANIRGGGEYGPAWHQSALVLNRQRAYDDFIAIAEDLIRRKVTTSAHLGIRGGSNGGLLTGVMLTQRPDLFGAVVSNVPLLDMKRYHKLLAGASWMEEYGDPEKPADWAVIQTYSPYQNVKADTKYPPVLFTTSTRDDRVHPGHARKMVARLSELKKDVRYYENTEGGHAGAANFEQQAYMNALSYAFLWTQLKK